MPAMPELPKRKLRWCQFSLRTLMIAVLVVGTGMATWIVPIKKRAERRKAVVDSIRQNGGRIVYDYEVDSSGNPINGAEPPGPAWLRRVLGDEFFATVIGATVTTSADMKNVWELSTLRSLGVFTVPITDIDLEGIEELSQLKSLDLCFTNITDAGLKHLKSLSQLEDLKLSNTRVTGSGLKELNGLSHLNALNLNETQITDAALESLAGLSQLEDLTLSGTKITDAGLVHVKRLAKLQFLWLHGSKVTDAGVKGFETAVPGCNINH